MAKTRIDNNVSIYPMPVVLAGAVVSGKANFLALGWIARVNYQPPMVAMSLSKGHYTNGGIREHKEFSVNFPGLNLLEKTDYCGLVSGRETDSLQAYYAGLASRAVAIIIDIAIISLISAVVIGAMSLFFDLPSIKRFIFWLNGMLPGIAQVFVWLTGPRFAGLFYLLFLYLYFIFFFSTTGQTVGKAIMGLRVVTIDGKRMGVKRSFIRTLCYTMSLAPLELGFLWVLGEDRRRAWQIDKIAPTYVLYVWDARYEENFLRKAVYQLTKKREA